MEGITIRNIEVFFSVMEQGSFTKAATELHLTQSAVSKIIANIERELDIQLFVRKHKELIITEAANDLYHEWQAPFTNMVESYHKIWKLQHQKNMKLRIGVVLNVELDFFWPLIDKITDRFPEVVIEYDSNRINSLIQQLTEDKLDLIFVPDFMAKRLEREKMAWAWAAKSDMRVVLPADHPLADQELTLEMIKDETFITLGDDIPDNKEYMQDLFRSHGYKVKFGKDFVSPENITMFWNANDGISLTDAFFSFANARIKLKSIPLPEVQNGIICGWNPAKSNIYVKRFVEELNNSIHI